MDHISQYDWCTLEVDTTFLDEAELDNCVIQKIITNKFYDPLLSGSDSETDTTPEIDWKEICKPRNKFTRDNQPNKYRHKYIPCLKPVPPYPQVSKLTIQQHNQLLKVMCSDNPHILSSEYVLRPTKIDRKVFEELKEAYEAEQKEYIEWAKSLWTNSHCIRALRPKIMLERVYEAEYKMKAQELESFPRNYRLAAQIPFEASDKSCVLTHQKDLVNVSISKLPQIEYPDLNCKFSIMKHISVPEPCTKHPCKFVLPNEKSVTMLPVTEIHRELAQYASEQGAQYMVSENALRCLIETDRRWNFPLSVCETIGPDGEKSNVVVMGSHFSTEKEASQIRSYKAYRHLLENSLITQSERAEFLANLEDASSKKRKAQDVVELSSDEEDDNLFIDAADLGIKIEPSSDDYEMGDIGDLTDQSGANNNKENTKNNTNNTSAEILNDLGVYNCTCKDSLYEKPPPRSFRKWKISSKTTNEGFDLIVHCSHKAKSQLEEIIMEPIPEYQLDLGGCRISSQKAKALALSLVLRKKASLLTVRVEAATGEIVRYDVTTLEEWKAIHGDPMEEISAMIHAAFNQLQGLLPGNYVMLHEPSHGPNAILYVSRPNAQDLSLHFKSEPLTQDDEAKGVKAPPVLEPVLLPYHKSRRILPCAFTPYAAQMAKDYRKPPLRQKAPPNAIKWPKKKKNIKKT